VWGIQIRHAPRQTTTFGFDGPPPMQQFRLAVCLVREPTALPRSKQMMLLCYTSTAILLSPSHIVANLACPLNQTEFRFKVIEARKVSA
jgi:hypothetical protein